MGMLGKGIGSVLKKTESHRGNRIELSASPECRILKLNYNELRVQIGKEIARTSLIL